MPTPLSDKALAAQLRKLAGGKSLSQRAAELREVAAEYEERAKRALRAAELLDPPATTKRRRSKNGR